MSNVSGGASESNSGHVAFAALFFAALFFAALFFAALFFAALFFAALFSFIDFFLSLSLLNRKGSV
ncbi:hypothetical protein BZQ65_22695 [Salmonella enterica subsp. enterica serovar Enteritidis]|nr:hypothetical protein [Salmonella enterica subsp. enterica serovar Enteritidis]EFC4058748.1 hypothetical protein [Escherichia coli]